MTDEYVEVRLLIPEGKVEDFLDFCEEFLDTMPAIHRIPAEARGYQVLEEIEAGGSATDEITE